MKEIRTECRHRTALNFYDFVFHNQNSVLSCSSSSCCLKDLSKSNVLHGDIMILLLFSDFSESSCVTEPSLFDQIAVILLLC